MFEGIVAHEWEKVKRKTKKNSKETKSREKNRRERWFSLDFVPLSFLRVLILINESVELGEGRLELEFLVATFMIIHTKDDCR